VRLLARSERAVWDVVVSVGVTGLPISPNGIIIVKDHQGRAAGDGFVQFTSPESVDRALEKHKEKIGHRWEDCVCQSRSGSGNCG